MVPSYRTHTLQARKTISFGWVKSMGYLGLESEICFAVTPHPQSEN